jgi:arginyl-tRNA synthetase
VPSSPVQELAGPLAEAVSTIAGERGAGPRLDRPASPDHGDYASPVALGLARELKAPPRDIAGRIVDGMRSPWIASAEIAGPGFINLRVAPAWYRHVLERIATEGASYGRGAAEAPRSIQVEFVSANPTGPVTVGSARNAAYGDSLARLFEAAGHRVSREYYFNDGGRQIELFGASLRARRRGEEPPPEGYQGAYVADIAAELPLSPHDSVELWARAGADEMMRRVRETLRRFRVDFDSWFREAELYTSGAVEAAIARVREGGHLYEHDGALWLRTTDYGDDKDRVVVRSNGTPGYLAGDLAYLLSKFDRGFDTAIYVLGADHHGYVGRLKAAAAALDLDPDRVDVQLYQLVHLVAGGELRKMSKRRGAVTTLDELIDAVGVDAARFALVQRSHDQTIELDLELLTAQNAENPVYYCQYAHARIAAIVRNAQAEGLRAGVDPGYEPEPPEAELVKALAAYPDVVLEAAERRGPHRIVAYVQETAKSFHQFYKQCRVIGAPPGVAESRLALCQSTGQVVASALGLIGVEAPESM